MISNSLPTFNFLIFFFSLPEEIIWFEPPTVCRWETISESEISEHIENKSTNGIPLSTQHSIKTMSRKTERSDVSITDFNLLRIPPKIDINFIIQNIIVPRLPDGYTIILSEFSRSSAHFSEAHRIKSDRIQIQSTNDFLIPTNSPRFLHPKRTLKFNVKIVERNPCETKPNEREYLLSQLIQDLDDLYDKQQPQNQIIKQMDEITDNLSMSLHDEHGSDQVENESNPDDMIFRYEEFPWNKKVENVPEVIEPIEESEDEFEESDDDDDDDDG